MSPITITPCTEKDLEQVIAKLPPFGLAHHHRSRFSEQLAGIATYLIAWQEDIPIGTVLISWHGDGHARVDDFLPNTPSIKALAVRPDLQSKGIGTQIMQSAENLVKEKGFGQVGLAVGTENTRARKLYERLDYQIFEKIAPYPIKWTVVDENGIERIEGETCIYLLKKLTR